jgi:hypothetical protein
VDPQPVAAGGSVTSMLVVLSPVAAFRAGARTVTLRVSDGARFETRVTYALSGPRPGDAGGAGR